MLRLDTKHTWYARSGLAILLLQISLFVLALKPFYYGTWYQVEPTMLGLFILAACNALWLAVGFFKRWLILERPFHPLFLCLMAWVIWQWLATLHAFSPWRSWFGQPAIGEGAGFYTAMLLSYLLAYPLWRKELYQKIIIGIAALNMAGMAWLHFDPATLCKLYEASGSENLGMPGNWADYLPFLVGYVWIALLAMPNLRTPPRYAWLAIISTLIVYYVSGSSAASWLFKPVFMLGGIILWVHVVKRPRWLEPNKLWRTLAIMGCLLPIGWIIASESTLWNGYNPNCSLPSRARFNQVSVATIAHEPTRLLLGDGWGRFPDDVFKYALVDGVYTFRNGARMPNWNIIDGHAFHSHNEITETLLSLGLPGMALWILLPIIAIWTMPAAAFWWCVPMLLAVTGLQSFWFFLPQVLAFQALMWVALSSRWYPAQPREIRGKWLAVVCALITLIMAWSANAQWNAMAYGEKLSHALTDEPSENYSVEWLNQDMARGGDRFHAGVAFYGDLMASKATDHSVTPRDTRWYLLLMQAAHQAALSPASGPWLASADVWLQNVLFMNVAQSDLDTLKPTAKEWLPESTIALSKKAPLREDITAPFLYNLDGFTGGDTKKSVDILQKILDVAPDHRAALWMMGQELAHTPGKEAEAHAMMQRAVYMDVTRVFPLTNQEVGQ